MYNNNNQHHTIHKIDTNRSTVLKNISKYIKQKFDMKQCRKMQVKSHVLSQLKKKQQQKNTHTHKNKK